MNMADTLIGILVIGIIVAFFSHVPMSTLENTADATRIVNYADVVDDIEYEIKKTKWEDYPSNSEKEIKVNEFIEQVKAQNKEYAGERYEVKGDVVVINEKEFIKIWFKDKKIYQEYFFGI